MVKCRVCGKRAWLNDLCSDCEAKMGVGSAQGGIFRSSRRTSVSIRSWVINVNAKGSDVSEGVPSPELLRKIATEAGLSEGQITSLLEGALPETLEPGVVDALTRAGVQLPALDEVHQAAHTEVHGPLHKVKCPACARTVPDRNGRCMYCGAELQQEEVAPAAQSQREVNDVDRAFLDQDVRTPESTEKEELHEGVRESYRDRLSDL